MLNCFNKLCIPFNWYWSYRPNSFLPNVKKCFLSTSYTEKGSVYIHWPYCKRRCSYCNFVKFIPRDNASWSFPDVTIEDALIIELESVLERSPIKTITSIFFGGGTPSLARPQLVERTLAAVSKNCSIPTNREVTLEANPTSLEAKKLLDFKLSGVNRLSLGVQSLQDDLLQMLNRDHSAKEAMSCIEEAKVIYPQKLSVDLIFALPGQTIHSWRKDLEFILSLQLDHLSLYQLTVERGTHLFNQVKAGNLKLMSKDEEADMYELALSLLTREGIHRYEISNFARNFSSESVHNKAVWQGGQYIGVGPGAHSRIVTRGLNESVREARINAADPRSWLNEVRLKGNGARRVVPQTRLDMQMEYIATSLRTTEGATEENWGLFSPSTLRTVFLASLLHPEFLVLEKGRLKATPKGMNVLDALLPRLIAAIIDHNQKL